MNKRRIIIAAFIALGLLFGFFWYRSYQKINIVYKEGVSDVTATIYATDTDNDEAAPEIFVNEKNIVKTVNEDASFRLQKGVYVFATSGNNNFEPILFKFEVNDSSKTIEVDPSYSKEHLATTLKQELPEIRRAIDRDVSGLTSAYIVESGELYEKGDWYGTIIYKSGSKKSLRSTYRDIFRLVAHKENGAWTVITATPELSLSKNTYPDVPASVLEATNLQEITTN